MLSHEVLFYSVAVSNFFVGKLSLNTRFFLLRLTDQKYILKESVQERTKLNLWNVAFKKFEIYHFTFL